MWERQSITSSTNTWRIVSYVTAKLEPLVPCADSKLCWDQCFARSLPFEQFVVSISTFHRFFALLVCSSRFKLASMHSCIIRKWHAMFTPYCIFLVGVTLPKPHIYTHWMQKSEIDRYIDIDNEQRSRNWTCKPRLTHKVKIHSIQKENLLL